MEQNFQTSFIPKKPMIEERAVAARPVSIFLVISIFILFTVLLASGGLYFYKLTLEKSIIKMENDLNLAQNRFEPSKIVQLQTLDRRLNASSEILAKHITISPIFKILQDLTMKSVRYTRFSYAWSEDKTTKVTINLSGQAVGYRSIALQSDLFAENKQLIDPVFSNLTLDNSGNVLFELEFTVDPALVDYKQTLQNESEPKDTALPANTEGN
jgi:hypothetical protein